MNDHPLVTEPFLFIAGVSKAGTTSLFEYLAAHPCVLPCRIKEPFYFVPDDFYFDPPLRYGRDSLERYLSLFPAGLKTHVRLEASSLYFMSPSIGRVLGELFPNARVVVSLREPVSRLISCYQMALFHEWIPSGTSIDQYIDQMLHWSPALSPAYKYLLEEGRYSIRLQQWFERLGRDRVQVVWFDDIKKNPLDVVNKIARFSGLDPTFYQSFKFRNENPARAVRTNLGRRAYRFIKRSLQSGLSSGSPAWRSLSRINSWVEPLVNRLNTRAAPPVAPNEGTLRALREYYCQDLAPLTQLLGEEPYWAKG